MCEARNSYNVVKYDIHFSKGGNHMKKTPVLSRILSMLLALAMVLGLVPVFPHQHAHAASNMENGFEGQDADVFSALGFDTTELPEGFDPDTTENPYGRNTILGNQVWEAFVASSGGTNVYGKNNNSVSGGGISGMPSSGAGIGMEMYSVAAADFDGDGLQGEVVYVGFDSIKYNSHSERANLQLQIYDAKKNSISDLKTIGTGINPAQVIKSGGTAYSRLDYAWQNLLQVTAGDYDCDGRYEIAVYVPEDGNGRVDIYKYQQTSQSGENDWMKLSNWDRVWSYVVNNTGNEIFNMVSLVSADINQDGVDDLGISYGRLAPYGNPFTSVDIDKSKAVILWGAKSNMLQKHSAVSLNEGELGELTRVSLTVGDLDGDGAKELIATGQPISDVEKYYSGNKAESNTTRAVITYLYDYNKGLVINSSGLYKPVDGKYIDAEDENGNKSKQWQSNNGFDENYYSDPLMRTNAAVFHPKGYDYAFLYLDSCLYECTEGQLMLKMSLDDGNYDGQSALGGDKWSPVLAGAISTNYVEYGVVAADINGEGYDTLMTNMFVTGSGYQKGETAEQDVRRHYASYRTLYSTGDALASKASGTANLSVDGIPSTLTTAALAMVDADVDTVIMEYTGVHYLTYSDPKVLAIIAAAPYFEDVDIISDYDYAWQNTTSYSQMNGGGHGDTVQVDFEGGIYLSTETEVGGGKIELETSVNFTLEWAKDTTTTTEYTLSFETSQDEDAVAFYCIPTENYVYKTYTPNGKGGYDEKTDIISNTFTPCYQVLTLDYYESIRGNYPGLPEVRGKAITSTPGDPSSYPTSTSGYSVISQWDKDPAGVSFGNGAITQEISVTTEDAESYNMGAAWDFQFGGGAGVNIFGQEFDTTGGVQWSLNPSGGWTDIKMEGTTISGTVTNMPLQFQDYGYYYTWKIFSYNYKFEDGTSIPVVSYVVGDVSEPPQLPEDFQQDYDRTTSDKNVLTWTYDGSFSDFYIYKYYDFPVGGGLQRVAEIPSSTPNYTLKYDENGKPYKEYYYEDLNLAPYAEYQYAIQVEREAPVPPLSAISGLLTARTKAANGNPVMTMEESDGEHDGLLKVYPDKTSYLTVGVTGPKGESASSYYTTVQYQWQKKENGAWTDLINETAVTLTFASAGVDTAGEYRCRVNVLTKADATAITAYTDPVSLTHAKRTSFIEELYVKDVSGGVELYAKVGNAHPDSASIPGGTVTFNLTNNLTGQNYQYFVELNPAGIATDIRETMLPEGMYSVTAYYSGSFIFKSSDAQTLYLSQRSAGFDVDAPASVVFGDGAEVVYRTVTKSNGFTQTKEAIPQSFTLLKADALSTKQLRGASKIETGESVSAGTNYWIDLEGIRYYFTATHSGKITVEDLYVTYGTADAYLTYTNNGGKYRLAENLPAGGYAVKMTTDGVAVYAPVNVLKRQITLQLPAQKIGEGVDHAPYVTLGSMQMLSGTWAPCDLVNGELNSTMADQIISLHYYNTAGSPYTGTEVIKQCGYYVVRDWGGTVNASKYPNYDIKLLDGSLTVIGATRDVSIGVRLFEEQSVGTLHAMSPEYGSTRNPVHAADKLVQSFSTGTRMVFTAVPDEGYEIYDWYINGVAQGTKATSLSYVLLAEDTTVEVQFTIKQNSLIFGTAGDVGGGTIVCSDSELTSDSVVLANALFTFTAKANPGYHFKEWRYTEQSKGTVYNDDENGVMESTFDLLMPATSCSVYAVFERDHYTFTYSDRMNGVGMTAWYMGNASGDTTSGIEKITIRSGDKVKGDTTIVVEAAPGYDLDSEYAFISKGTQGQANYEAGTYTLKLGEDTDVTAVTNRQSYDVKLDFSVKQDVIFPEGTKLIYTIGEKQESLNIEEATGVTLEDVPGGSDIHIHVEYPGYYDLIGWVDGQSGLTATEEVNKAAVEVKFGDTVEAGTAYWYTVSINNANVARYFTAPITGIVRWNGEKVTVYGESNNYRITGLNQDTTISVRLEEKPHHYVDMEDISGFGTYELVLPEGSAESVGANNVKRILVHDGDDLTVLVTPEQKWTVSYWQAKAASMSDSVKVRATSLKYTIPDIRESYTFKPIFSSTTYNTISWPTISADQNSITLSPENGYLSSVSSGSSFKFKLTGPGMALVDQVFANGVPFVAAGSANAGNCTVSGDVYTISNIQENQVITVTMKEVGVTVNGEDLVNMHGSGWVYDHGTQTLTLSRSGLIISGSVKISGVDNLKIVLLDTAATVTLENLNLSSTATNVITASGETCSVVLSGSNTITSRTNGSILTVSDTSNESLIIRGNGTLNLYNSGNGYAIAANTVTFTGNCNVNIYSTEAGGVNANELCMGIEGSTTEPSLRIQQTGSNANRDPIYAGDIEQYNGELLVRGIDAAIVCNYMYTYDGVVELSSEKESKTAFSGVYWLAYYTNGYMKRYTERNGSEAKSIVVRKADYLLTDYDLVQLFFATTTCNYFRLSPLSSEPDASSVVLTVTYNGKEYSAPISGGSAYQYYYIDLNDLNDTTLKTAILENGKKFGEEMENEHWLAVAYTQASPVYTTLATADITFEYRAQQLGEPFDAYKADIGSSDEVLEYSLSGGDTSSLNGAIATSGSVQTLTLDHLTAGTIDVGSTPVYLKGDNYLISMANEPLVTDGTLNLYSDGTGTLTVNSRIIPDAEGAPVTSALVADTINLHDVKALMLFSGTNAVTAGSKTKINFYDGDTVLQYGQGWNIDEGTTGSNSSTLHTAAIAGNKYLKVYADTTDGSITPDTITVDKETLNGQVKEFAVKYMAVDGNLIGLKTDTDGDTTYTSVLLINSAGEETVWKLALGDEIPAGYQGCYRNNGASADLKLDLSKTELAEMPVGTYTIRFRQQDQYGALHNLDVTMKLTAKSIISGDLSVTPTTVTLSRGQSVTLTTAFTGTTPSSYQWSVDGKSVQVGAESSYTFTVPADAKVGKTYTIQAASFSGNDALGAATATITVCNAVSDITITNDQLKAEEDGSYTVHTVQPDAQPGVWEFNALVTMDDGTTATDVVWTLWGNDLRATHLDPTTGVLTVSPVEVGTDGIMKVIATYTNADGTTGTGEIVLNVNTDPYVGITIVGTVNGEAVTDIHGTVSANTYDETYAVGGEDVIVTAYPDPNHTVAGWTVNGEAVTEWNTRTNTMTFPGEVFGHYLVTVEFTHYHSERKHDDQNHWMECSCGDRIEITAHDDKDHDHNCDVCGYVMSTCYDDDKNHFCDYCGAKQGDCADENHNHLCDWCGDKLSDCVDENTDHICEYCGGRVSDCGDVNSNHFCDYCGEKISTCYDADDHNCDICGRELSECADTDDHNCDICGKVLSKCADKDKDHLCDICGIRLTECYDKNKDHLCDQCGEPATECVDANNDHLCDLCKETISECVDENKDHKCDICGKDLSNCVDENKDHNCDDCGAKLTDCADADNNHLCDICSVELSQCADENGDHNCDKCGKKLSDCADTAPADHFCDTCGKHLTPCVDENSDHTCDICGKELGVHDCADENSDHRCDTCGETLTPCADNDSNHLCDLCGKELSECADEDADHKCDKCGKILTECADETKDHLCDLCGTEITTCADENSDHNCDVCSKPLSECSDGDNDHKCDICGKQTSTCADDDKDHKCDLCSAVLTACVDDNSDHNCDICSEPVSACADENKDHSCDICNKELSTCADENKDHNCDICSKPLTECADEDNDHFCDLCGKQISTCVDEKDHLCDICGQRLTQCVDEDPVDQLCDLCGEDMHQCADEDNDHDCDFCEFVLTQCIDENADHACDICGATNSVCVDADSDHNCDLCGKPISKCLDENSDHDCDTCGEKLTDCVDADHNDFCDICGAGTNLHVDKNKDHRCDVCALPLSECDDEDKDHLCDLCGVVWSVCVDKNTDHACDICGGTMGVHAPAEGTHRCDYCGKDASECADETSDHLCDTCDKVLSDCVDEVKDHLCDICGKELSKCLDEDKNHICDWCGQRMSDCADPNEDGYCDYCGEPILYTIHLIQPEEGTITSSHAAAAMETPVTFTVALNPGKTLLSVNVVDVEGAPVAITDNGDGTYSYIQPRCEVTISVTYSNDLFSISFASMTMANSLDMNFAFLKAYRSDWTGYYAEIVKEYEDRESVTQYIFFEDWKTTTINGELYHYVTFTGIAAKEMTDKLSVTIYSPDGVAASTVWEDSVQAQAMRNLAKTGVTKLSQTMVVDMLNYGAAAQKKFEYHLDNLANSLLSEEQKGFATTAVSYVDTSKRNDNYRANVYLVSNIQFMMAFANIDPTMNAEVTFTDHYGKEHLITIPGSEFEKNGSYYVFTIEETVIADAYQNITCKIYNADGKLVNQVTDSMASYAARAKQNTGDELYEMIMKFATSAHAYLHSK